MKKQQSEGEDEHGNSAFDLCRHPSDVSYEDEAAAYWAD